MSMKNSSDTIGNRTRDLPACSAVPQPTVCGFKTSDDAFRLSYSIAFSCSIRPFLDLFHSWLYIYSIFPGSPGTASLFPSFRFPVNHNSWYSWRRINATEVDALRRSARISKLDRKRNEYIRGKMDAQDMVLDDITRKQLTWYDHVERMDPTRLPRCSFTQFIYIWKLLYMFRVLLPPIIRSAYNCIYSI